MVAMWSSQLFQSSSFWTIVGVVVGFLLGEGSRYGRYRIDLIRKKRLLIAELGSIRAQIPQKRDMVRQIIDALQQRTLLPGTSVPILSLVYRSVISDLYPHLSSRERNCLHAIYERLQVADEFLRELDDRLLQSVKNGVFPDPYEAFTRLLRDLDASYEIASELMMSYLQGNPVDVFSSERSKLTKTT